MGTKNKQLIEKLSRRNFLRNSIVASAGIAALPSLLTGCGDDDDSDPFVPAGVEGSDFGFLQGVASFDPTQNQVVLWSRYTPDANETTDPSIILDVATDADFAEGSVVASETVQIDVNSDYTIIVDLANLSSNTVYYYRFRNDVTGVTSVIGQTKTLPGSGEATEVKLAVVSCANFQAGLFNVYGAVAASEADIVVHLGDYIYEYGSGPTTYGTDANGTDTVALGREHDPSGEIVTVDAYRARYRQYRGDEQLQEAHRLKPFICVWDDHEIANDAFQDGAENHDDSEGSFEVRKANAFQVWHEYLPARVTDNSIIYRNFEIGDIVNLIMLDTRIIGREEQLNYLNYLQSDGSLDANAFLVDWLSPTRTILGITQKSWVTDQLTSNTASWQVLGSQVLMAKYQIPTELLTITAQIAAGDTSEATLVAYNTLVTDLVTIKARIELSDPTVTDEEKARVETVLPYNLDAWDGYPVERDEILAAAAQAGKKLISIAGDTHNAWYAEHSLTDLGTGQKSKVGAEFATASVSSPGFEGIFGTDPNVLGGFEQANVALIDDLKYADASQRGYLLTTFTAGEATADWRYVSQLSTVDDSATSGNMATES